MLLQFPITHDLKTMELDEHEPLQKLIQMNDKRQELTSQRWTQQKGDDGKEMSGVHRGQEE